MYKLSLRVYKAPLSPSLYSFCQALALLLRSLQCIRLYSSHSISHLQQHGFVFSNKFEGAQVEHGRIRMTEAPTQVKRDRIAQIQRNYRNRKRQNDSDESRQAELNAECQRKAKSRRLAKDELNIKNIKEREALIEK
jgi:hypothetical protein